jgi:hypothetical protein
MQQADRSQEALATLRYKSAWREWEFISEEKLRKQWEAFRSGIDPNTEHYRYASFRAVLDERDVLDDVSVARYIELARQDEDPVMARAALVDLILWPKLTNEQFENLSQDPTFAAPTFQKFILRRRLLSEIGPAAPVTEAVFYRCLVSQDAVVQRQLVEVTNLLSQQLEQLGEQGASRAVRNLAQARLRRSTSKKERI